MRMTSIMAVAMASVLAMANPTAVPMRPVSHGRRREVPTKPQHPLGSKLKRRLLRKHQLGRSGSF